MSQVSGETALISIEVELKSTIKGDPTKVEKTETFMGEFADSDAFKNAIEQAVQESVDESVNEILAEEGVDAETVAKLKDLTKDIDSKGIGNVKSMARNPEGFMESTFLSVLSRAGPYGALAAAIISAIAGAPEMVKAVVQAIGVKGAPLNQDYAWTEEEQFNQQFSRAVQYRRLTGDDPVITVTSKGFVAGDPDFVDNSLVAIETGRMGRVDLRQSSLGYVHGL